MCKPACWPGTLLAGGAPLHNNCWLKGRKVSAVPSAAHSLVVLCHGV